MAETTAQFQVRIRSDPALVAGVRRGVEAFALAHGLNDAQTADIGLCVNEAIANIIRHAYRGERDRPIEITATDHGNEIRIDLRDWGTGVVPDVDCARHDPLTPGGLGLPCLKKLMDGLEFVRQPDGMLLRMSKRKSQA